MFSRNLTFMTTIALLAGALLVTGCATSGPQQMQKTTQSLTGITEQLTKGKVQIDATVSAMNAMAKPASGDLTAAYKSFQSQVAKLQSSYDGSKSRSAEMRKKKDEYLAAWQKQLDQISNEKLKERSAERRQDVIKGFDKVKEAADKARTDFDPFMKDLGDIESYLAAQLTPAAVESIDDVIKRTNKEADAVKKSIDELMKAVDELVGELTSVQATTAEG